MLQTDETSIKLHVGPDARVWVAAGVSPAYNSGKTTEDFLATDGLKGFGALIRIIGIPQNAGLISGLYLRRASREVVSVEVAGPNILNNSAEADNPELAIRRMRAVQLSSAAGGWHTLSNTDYPVYALLSKHFLKPKEFDVALQAYFKLHPAYKAASFIPTISSFLTAQLFCAIIDPRWYVDTRSPDRTSKLELYLGLTPQTQAKVSNSKKIITGLRTFKCASVLAAWKTKQPDEVDMGDPANFLYRIHAHYGGGATGDLRASQSFVRYIRHNWLAAIENRVGPKDGLFVPNMFFKTPEECAAYTAHMQTTGK
jgi:hypothetical protein